MVQARRAVAADAAELVRLREIMLAEMTHAVPEPDGWQESVAEDFRTRLADPDDTMAAFVVDDPTGDPDRSSSLAACAVGLVEPRLGGPGNPAGEIGYILNVATDPWHRRQGYSRACMQALLDWYRERGIVTVDLQATEVSEPLYRSLGFVPAPNATMRLAVRS